jgi:ubiquitin-like-conjugating enzyme ATG3
MFNFDKKKYQKHLNPFENRPDIQPGVSPEIIDDVPFPSEIEKPNKGFLGWLGFSNAEPERPFTGERLPPLPSSSPSLQESYTHSLYETLQSLSARILPLSSAILNGHLTVEEFVQAGDFLVKENGNWEWSYEPDKMNINFPPDKQFLINRGLPCQSRFDSKGSREKVHLDFSSNELWSCPQPPKGDLSDSVHIYDVSLTYDPTTRTPRVWLAGYSEEGKPLTMDEIARDIYVDFVGTAATMIPHPFTNVLNVSIHPCRHAEGMSRLIATANGNPQDPFRVEQYMTYFLKLITCIIPTINVN